MITVHNRLEGDAWLGVVYAAPVDPAAAPAALERRLAAALARRRAPLAPAEEAVRAAARDMLRWGAYRPTGRGKPASEYLLRAAGPEGEGFPRINAPVDACNLVSLEALLPISLWDVDLAAADAYTFRRGRPEEAYVFNASGQAIALRDLAVGCRLGADGAEEPIVNPVKDSLATKTTPQTRRVAAAVYAPAMAAEALPAVCEGFAALLAACGAAVQTAWGVAGPGQTLRLAQ